MVEVMRLENSPLSEIVRVFELAPLALAPAVVIAAGLVYLARRWRSRRDAGIAERCWSLPAFTGVRPAAGPVRPPARRET